MRLRSSFSSPLEEYYGGSVPNNSQKSNNRKFSLLTYMRIDGKNLSMALITSIIVTGVLGLISSLTYLIVAIPDMPPAKISYTVATTKEGYSLVLSLTGIIVLGLICILILTLVFYFLIGFLRKRQKLF